MAFQWPCRSLAHQPSTLAQRPWVRPCWSSRGLVDEHPGGADQAWLDGQPTVSLAGDVGTTLLDGLQTFLNGTPPAQKEAPDGVLANHDSARPQLRLDRPQRQIGHLPDPRQQPARLGAQHIRLAPAHRPAAALAVSRGRSTTEPRLPPRPRSGLSPRGSSPPTTILVTRSRRSKE